MNQVEEISCETNIDIMGECDIEWSRFLNGDDINEETYYNDTKYTGSIPEKNDGYIEDSEYQDSESLKMTTMLKQQHLRESSINVEDIISDIKISTTTKITYLNKAIDLKKDFWKIDVMDYYTEREGVIKKQMKYIIENDDEQDYFDTMIKSQTLYTELMDLRKKNIIGTTKKTGSNVYKVSIGVRSKDIINQKAKKTQAFFNCFVLVIRMKIPDTTRFTEVHMKIFNTGKIEIPGMKNNETFYRVLDIFKKLYKRDTGCDIMLKRNDVETILINSNFNCGFYINREKLYHILKEKYNMNCSYDPCTYPGIQNIFYFDENDKDIDFNGLMSACPEKVIKEDCAEYNEYIEPVILTPKQKAAKIKKHRKERNYVSFMVFRTGSILIVGKCDEVILMKIYDFIKNMLISEYDIINSGLNDFREKDNNTHKNYRPIKYNIET